MCLFYNNNNNSDDNRHSSKSDVSDVFKSIIELMSWPYTDN